MNVQKSQKCGYVVPIGVEIRGRYDEEFAKVLTKDALHFVAHLVREFKEDIKYAMKCRSEAKARYNCGLVPGFDPETRYIRDGDWVCSPPPTAVADRRVEITGPVDRKMVINALNSQAKVFMADFEDALSPSWENLIQGQVNLRDAVNGTITFQDKAKNRVYKLNDQIAKLFVRPRGWHLPEAHILIDGEPAIGCLVDFGLYFYHNYSQFLLKHGDGFGPFFYLPKLEHSRQRIPNPFVPPFYTNPTEAKIWNRVFEKAEKTVGIEKGSVRATVLIETLPAVFQMNEILYELREHSIGLNCGRWDYIFSYIKTFQSHPTSYSDLLIYTCHRRGVHAMGGMAAQIPIKDNAEANELALELVKMDKLREVQAGHDGTWAAHPGLIPTILKVFDETMGKSPNQINSITDLEPANISEDDLLRPPQGVRTMEGLRLNTRVGIQYLAAWLTGSGAVPLYNLMEDAVTAEISRAQNWQWVKYRAELDGDRLGVRVTPELFESIVDEEMKRIKNEVGIERFQKGKYVEASEIFAKQCLSFELDDFLTLEAYNHIIILHPKGLPGV
ncbi:hypothetical protein RND81_06G065600 [Saponaria officinalis]|uniref:Malate synthase n=1 Tax=Saponaria officinalis TaxID=3572 RepID=A0AAW1K8Q9_SAPOF